MLVYACLLTTAPLKRTGLMIGNIWYFRVVPTNMFALAGGDGVVFDVRVSCRGVDYRFSHHYVGNTC